MVAKCARGIAEAQTGQCGMLNEASCHETQRPQIGPAKCARGIAEALTGQCGTLNEASCHETQRPQIGPAKLYHWATINYCSRTEPVNITVMVAAGEPDADEASDDE